MISRIILTSSIVLVLVVSPHILYAQTTAAMELQTTISGLLEQVKALQLKLSQAQGGISGDTSMFVRTLGLGSSGDDVKQLQGFLAKDNTLYPEGLVTGYFGSFTEKAVERFQTKNGIVFSGTPRTTGFGLLGPKTRAKLNELIARDGGSTSPIPLVSSQPEEVPAETVTTTPPIVVTPPSPPSRKAYIVNELDGTLSVIDLTTETVIQTAKIAEGGGTLSGILSIVSSPDKTRLYVTDYRADKVIVIRRSDMGLETTIDVGDGPDRMAITPDGNKLYVANLLSDTVSVVDTKSATVTKTLSTDKKPTDITISPDGTRIYVTHYYERGITSSNPRVLVVDTATDVVVGEIKLPTSSLSQKIVITPDGTKANISIQDSDAVGVINVASGSLMQTIHGILEVNYMTVSADGKELFVVSPTDDVPGITVTSKIYVISTATEKIVRQLSGVIAPRNIVVTKDGLKLYATDRKDDTVKIIDLTTDTVVKTISVGNAPYTVIIVE